MAIENSVSNNFWSAFIDSINFLIAANLVWCHGSNINLLIIIFGLFVEVYVLFLIHRTATSRLILQRVIIFETVELWLVNRVVSLSTAAELSVWNNLVWYWDYHKTLKRSPNSIIYRLRTNYQTKFFGGELIVSWKKCMNGWACKRRPSWSVV